MENTQPLVLEDGLNENIYYKYMRLNKVVWPFGGVGENREDVYISEEIIPQFQMIQRWVEKLVTKPLGSVDEYKKEFRDMAKILHQEVGCPVWPLDTEREVLVKEYESSSEDSSSEDENASTKRKVNKKRKRAYDKESTLHACCPGHSYFAEEEDAIQDNVLLVE
jgi:hypothetical protein